MSTKESNLHSGERVVVYSRGSEWHRWDLHLHTPETKKNDNYEGGTPQEKWDNFYGYINDYLKKGGETSDVAAVGITDYCSIDNYEKVIDDRRLPDNLFILPNVEMRLPSKSGNGPVNIHFLFDPEYVDKIKDDFFAELVFNFQEETYKATESSLIALGKAILEGKGEQGSDDVAYRRGLESFIPELAAYRKVFKKHPDLRAHTMIGVPNSSKDGASGLGNGQMEAYRDSLYQFCDFIFSGNPKDRKYFLGQGCDPEMVIADRYGSIMPCLHGCDAHELSKIFEPDEERYCWIKAEPTFNGLKQVLYEPESRVLISPSKPDIKSGYQVIKSVQFLEDDVDREVIPLNQNLNCIIGGRSTGKTLFLQNLAAAVDNEQVERRKDKALPTSLSVETSVTWSDGSVSDRKTPHKIMYIPQSYLNRLSDDVDASEINDMIEPILLADSDVESAKKAVDREIAELSGSIRREALEFGELANKIRQLSSEISEIGTREGITSEINNISRQRAEIATQNQISEESIAQYNEAQKKLRDGKVTISAIAADAAVVESIDTLIAKIKPWPTSQMESTQTGFAEAWDEIRQNSRHIWDKHKRLILADLQDQKREVMSKRDEVERTVVRLKPAIDKTAELKSLSERHAKETKRLEEFNQKAKKMEKAQHELHECLGRLFRFHESFAKARKDFADRIATSGIKNRDGDGGVLLSADVVYKYDELASYIMSAIDGRKLRSRKELRSFVEDLEHGQDSEYPKQQIEKLILDAVNDDNLIKVSLDKFVSDLFADHTAIRYGAEMDGDGLALMSPGKKALLCLKLLIELDKSRSPILIDQPEDDLDNRSIYNELIPFLKEKKSSRQMIIVTHNANVVLGADAEEIIVANQSGADSLNQNARFEYITGSIEDNLPQDPEAKSTLQSKSIQQHICEVLEGGQQAFELRRHKYTTLVG